MNYIYFTYRRIWDNKTNRYDVSYYNDLQYSDYKEAWLTEMIDWDRFIPENRIIKEIYPWIKTLRCAWVMKFDTIDKLELEISLKNVASNFAIEILTSEQMIQWIKDNTDLQEIEGWKFLIFDETEINWQIIPKQTLSIN